MTVPDCPLKFKSLYSWIPQTSCRCATMCLGSCQCALWIHVNVPYHTSESMSLCLTILLTSCHWTSLYTKLHVTEHVSTVSYCHWTDFFLYPESVYSLNVHFCIFFNAPCHYPILVRVPSSCPLPLFFLFVPSFCLLSLSPKSNQKIAKFTLMSLATTFFSTV